MVKEEIQGYVIEASGDELRRRHTATSPEDKRRRSLSASINFLRKKFWLLLRRFGKSSYEDGYRAFEACHVKATVYKNQTLRFRIRENDRYNERVVAGEIKREVTLILKGITTKLQEQNIERGRVLEMLRDALGTMWDFLHYDISVV